MSNYNNGQQPIPPQAYPPQMEPVMTLKDWIITLLITMIPCVGFIMVIVWAFSDVKKTKQNWARATLIMMVIGVILGGILSVFLTALIAPYGGYYYY